MQSRYYDPVTHRFINADDIGLVTASPNTLTDKNLYAYCDNNPITRADDGGDFWEVVAVSAAIGFTVGFVSSIASDLISGNEVNWGRLLLPVDLVL